MKKFCVILTHKHGACVGIINSKISPAILKETFFETSAHYSLKKSNLIQSVENIEFITNENSFVFARSLGKTAENLTHLFQFAVQTLCIQNDEIKKMDLILGAGPGSFTGLRLGYAFANGLSFASEGQQNIFSVPTLLTPELAEQLSPEPNIKNMFFDELGKFNENDPSSGYVTFFDLFYALHEILKGNLTKCLHFIPQYGREPTPTIKLRKE